MDAYKCRGVTLKNVKADITKIKTDVIVNAANNELLGGGGVDGAIHRAAGPGLLEECKELNGCDTGDVKITEAYNIPSKFIFHTVGPIYTVYEKIWCATMLADCYYKCLQLVDGHGFKSIAFPAISCGVYGYPLKEACDIAIDISLGFINNNRIDTLDEIIFCNFDDAVLKLYSDKFKMLNIYHSKVF